MDDSGNFDVFAGNPATLDAACFDLSPYAVER